MRSIKGKLYIYILCIVLLIASGSIIFTNLSNSKQIEKIYKDITTANAKNFATTLDGDYITELTEVLRSEEFQEVRDQAVEEDNNLLVENYLEDQGLWEQYLLMQCDIDSYIRNMQGIKYLYIVEHADIDATEDMFICDDSTNDLYDCAGRYEEREEEFLGQDLTTVEPTVSYSDEWGWLASDYAPVYDSHGNIVALVGCDVDYTNIVEAKRESLIWTIFITIVISVIVIIGSLVYISKYLIDPLVQIANAVVNFKPNGNTLESGVISLNMDKRNDEIGQIYNNIRGNQLDIVDYIKSITEMKEDLEEKDTEISMLNFKSLRDPLTSVGNKAAYMQKIGELNAKHEIEYAIVMVDINNLKEMNDKYGHKAGDWYIQGCSRLICKTFRHSPVFRIGGDEFVVIVENEDYINRHLRYEELEKAFEISYQKQTDKPWEKLSASCGMAEIASDDNSAELVFKRADKAMYENKAKFKAKYGSYR